MVAVRRESDLERENMMVLRQKFPSSLRVQALFFSSLLLLAGCASMSMTLAQELAWERWKQCDHFPRVTLRNIDLDGKIWVYQYYDTHYREFQECLRKAAEEQAARRVVAVTPPAAVSPAPVAKEQAVRPVSSLGPPVWKVADEWAYRWESPQGKGTFVWSVDREEILDGIVFYVVKAGQREMYWRKSDFAFYVEKMSGVIERRHVPFSLRYAWPLTIGKTWESRFTEEKPVDQQTNDVARSCEVETEESVLVPAGTFRTLMIVCRNSVTGSVTSERWYSPEVKQWVRERTHFSYGVRERELIDFKLR